MKLSIIVPVFNEEKTIVPVLEALDKLQLPAVIKDIIVVDDGSRDNTKKYIEKSGIKNIKFFSHPKNLGKGAALRTGIKHAEGEYIIIQDADLEYNPKEIAKLIKPITDGKAKVVYGTRLRRLPNFSRDERTSQFFLHYLGNKFLSLLTSILYFSWVTDMESCYKLFPKKAIDGMIIRARGFEFEPEITAKLLKRGYKIYEVPISTNPRGYDEGKKLNTFRDGFKAVWNLVKYRVMD